MKAFTNKQAHDYLLVIAGAPKNEVRILTLKKKKKGGGNHVLSGTHISRLYAKGNEFDVHNLEP